MKVIIVKENNIIRVIGGAGVISNNVLGMRSRFNEEIKYYELDYNESLGMSLYAYIEAINNFPDLLEKSKLIKEIYF